MLFTAPLVWPFFALVEGPVLRGVSAVKPATIPCALLAAWSLLSSSAIGQRITLATPDPSAAQPAGTVYTPAPTATTAPGGWVPAGSTAYTAAQPPAGGTTYAPPGGMVYGSVPAPGAAAPAGTATFGPAPMATLNGTVQPPTAWDPYAPPNLGPPSLLPQDPYYQPGQFGDFGEFPGQMYSTMQRFRQSTAMDFHWFAGSGQKDHELGITDVELTSTFAIPLYNLKTPLLITPGFGFHFWNGPESLAPDPAEMPAETYDAFLDTAWNPEITPWLSAELDFLLGVFSDFKGVDMESLRPKGKGLAVLTFSPSFKIKAGVWYLNRVHVKILPAGGIVWQPNPDTRFDITFPNPRFTQKLGMTGNTEWWWYLSGEYGGGVWTIERTEGPDAGNIDTVDYDDIRVALGLEFKRLGGLTGLFETGFAFNRELRYRSDQPDVYYPKSTMFLRAGLAF
jgi:hypothetical protein